MSNTETAALIAAAEAGLEWLKVNAETAPIAELKDRRSAARAAAYEAFNTAKTSERAAFAHHLLVSIDQF